MTSISRLPKRLCTVTAQSEPMSIGSSAGQVANNESRCWLCDNRHLILLKPSNLEGQLTSDSFSITDSHYGMTGAIYECSRCHFRQCSDLPEALPYYEQLVDAAYEEGRFARSVQARKILEVAREFHTSGRLLDIGAGTGFLVEQALQVGFAAQGIEPSVWLQRTALKHGLPVELGTFPHPAIAGPFDVITLIDVIEHVSNPIELLKAIGASLAPGGTAILVTPDVGSVAARLLPRRWWHFRVAHIGYFNRQTLFFALDQAGLQPVRLQRPCWYLPLGYLWERTYTYLPSLLRMPPPSFLVNAAVAVNLRDSWMVACTKKD